MAAPIPPLAVLIHFGFGWLGFFPPWPSRRSVIKQGKRVQGLWRSAAGAELSLVTTPGGVVVGVYRVQEVAGARQYPLSGHAVAGHLAFSIPFTDQRVIASWAGTLTRDADGWKLEFVRRMVGHDLDGFQGATLDTFRRVDADEPAATVIPFPSADGGAGSKRA